MPVRIFYVQGNKQIIESLITTRCDELGLNKAQLVRLAGYKNEAKGIRRLDARPIIA
jgi:hypothetical protein